jgi:hypothetical protein
VPHQAFAVRANQHELLFVAADELSDGNTAALRYGIGKQTVSLPPSWSAPRKGVFSKQTGSTDASGMNSLRSMLLLAFGFEAFRFLFVIVTY